MIKNCLIRIWPTVAVMAFLCILAVAPVGAVNEVDPAVQEALDRGDTTQAIQLLNQRIQGDPSYHINYAKLGAIYYNQEQFDRAKEALKQALDKKKSDLEALYYLGLTEIKLENLDEAEKLMDQGRKKAKGKEKGMFEDGYGLVMMAKKNYQEADKAFRQALIVDEENPLYHIHLGNANFRQGIPSLAVSEYEKALESDTASTEVYYNWAEACLEMRDYTCALEKLRVVLQKDSTHASAWNRAGGIYFKAARSATSSEDRATMYKNTIGSYKKYLELSGAKPDSANVRPYFELAMSYLNLNGFEDAVKYFEEVLSIPYEPKDIYYNIGKAYFALKELEKGSEYLKKHLAMVEESGGETSVSPSEINQFIGDSYFYQKPPQYAEAVSYYLKVLEVDSTDKRLLQNIAIAYHTTNNYPEAMYYYQKRIALGVDSASSAIYKNAGLCALTLGSSNGVDVSQQGDQSSGQLVSTDPIQFDPNVNWYQVAADYFVNYLEYNPDDAKAVQLLGNTYLFQLNNCSQGITQYERLLQLDPTDCIAKRSLGFAYFGGQAGCPKNYSRALDYLTEAYQCISRTEGGCKDPDVILWIAQAYHLRGADRSKDDKAGSKADFKNAYEWYGKVLECQPGNQAAKKARSDIQYEF